MKKTTALEIISALFILLFVYTATSKLMQGNGFEYALAKTPFISKYAAIIAITLPATEIIIALLLLAHRTRLLGLYSAGFLMVIFTSYLAYMIAFAPHLPCSCGGVLRQMSWKQHLVFNIFFTGLAFTGIWLHKHPKTPAQKKKTSPVVFS